MNANVLLDPIGLEKLAWLALEAEFILNTPRRVNVLLVLAGMDTDALNLNNAQMVNNMMFSLIAANAQLELPGMEHFALSLINAEAVNSSMKDTNVSAPMELTSKMDFAKQLDVMGAKFGTVLHVLASKGLIGMELCALCVLMGRSGTKEQGHALVSAIMFGMAISVRKA